MPGAPVFGYSILSFFFTLHQFSIKYLIFKKLYPYLDIIVLNIDHKSTLEAKGFNHPDFVHIVNSDVKIDSSFLSPIRGLPTYLLFDKYGKQIEMIAGGWRWSEKYEGVNALINILAKNKPLLN